jgi:hypothetical protein
MIIENRAKKQKKKKKEKRFIKLQVSRGVIGGCLVYNDEFLHLKTK